MRRLHLLFPILVGTALGCGDSASTQTDGPVADAAVVADAREHDGGGDAARDAAAPPQCSLAETEVAAPQVGKLVGVPSLVSDDRGFAVAWVAAGSDPPFALGRTALGRTCTRRRAAYLLDQLPPLSLRWQGARPRKTWLLAMDRAPGRSMKHASHAANLVVLAEPRVLGP